MCCLRAVSFIPFALIFDFEKIKIRAFKEAFKDIQHKQIINYIAVGY
jgi:hypothetical protein